MIVNGSAEFALKWNRNEQQAVSQMRSIRP